MLFIHFSSPTTTSSNKKKILSFLTAISQTFMTQKWFLQIPNTSFQHFTNKFFISTTTSHPREKYIIQIIDGQAIIFVPIIFGMSFGSFYSALTMAQSYQNMRFVAHCCSSLLTEPQFILQKIFIF